MKLPAHTDSMCLLHKAGFLALLRASRRVQVSPRQLGSLQQVNHTRFKKALLVKNDVAIAANYKVASGSVRRNFIERKDHDIRIGGNLKGERQDRRLESVKANNIQVPKLAQPLTTFWLTSKFLLSWYNISCAISTRPEHITTSKHKSKERSERDYISSPNVEMRPAPKTPSSTSQHNFGNRGLECSIAGSE
ncbi:hypothetical protein E2P81_ATG02361 [Venturia nashicola]|nr:hypothetical protein E2P81_ATG02361 [Venturia nashicola]